MGAEVPRTLPDASSAATATIGALVCAVAWVSNPLLATFATSLNLDYLQPTLEVALRYNALDKPVNAAALIVQV